MRKPEVVTNTHYNGTLMSLMEARKHLPKKPERYVYNNDETFLIQLDDGNAWIKGDFVSEKVSIYGMTEDYFRLWILDETRIVLHLQQEKITARNKQIKSLRKALLNK